MGLLKTDGSVSTLALSEDMSQQDLNSLELTNKGGTPLMKIWSCCLPQSGHEETPKSLSRSEDKIRSPPPVVVAEIAKDYDHSLEKPAVENKEEIGEEVLSLFDSGLMWQMAILGGFLVGQACNIF
mmetsp:Transcript_97602/g.280862  ORF Transcript_97602/g.280862 Transcript_97602/m.280862 type:complete len:126 (-) Transcript_97602:137-514(-)|eukprot:CAMPEP_0170282400 /NCGR_PEP_ID=MMETSP0116_2-20130129/41223_1 /TAXON_ID=400756 /ORGANISM="Durinskia baltica, Strain CSIRO CS-38" /LENGTH=125 /DNA_ID=CAMNT_0010533749 /DNA_START=53 /DNA_END=430 /DNA_ORIENTATION=-